MCWRFAKICSPFFCEIVEFWGFFFLAVSHIKQFEHLCLGCVSVSEQQRPDESHAAPSLLLVSCASGTSATPGVTTATRTGPSDCRGPVCFAPPGKKMACV